MYRRTEGLGPFTRALNECLTIPEGAPSLYHELGYAIVSNNLALKRPGYPHESLKRQFERMLGVRVEGRFEPGPGGAVDPCSFDVLGRLYERAAQANGTRQRSGEFYTPPSVVDYMVGLLGLEADAGLAGRKFIDIACGSGAFVTAGMRKVIRLLIEQGTDGPAALQYALDSFYGLDISRTACDICKINMYLVLLDELGPEALARSGDVRPNVFAADAIDRCPAPGEDGEAARIKRRLGKYAGGFDYIFGNPPYLEAKKMPAAIKAACRKSWPGLHGAFDLYMPFLLQCGRLVSEGGIVCLILPDKFTVAGYARGLRERMLDQYSLIELADLSGMDVFSKAMVYPAVVAYRNGRPAPGHRVRTRISIRDWGGLAAGGGYAAVPQDLYRSTGPNRTLFCLPEEGDVAGLLRRLFGQGLPISDFVRFRSAVSFHAKGLREQFVRPSFEAPAGPVAKYLGGRSHAKRNEVGPFQFRWEGFYIDYDREGLREYRNVLPPLGSFLQEKIVLCQHAPRITAAYDGRGEFVTKDVYPIGIAAPGLAGSPLSLKYFAALLNSELMSFVYGTIYKGVQIGGGYYHYLPTWLSVLPVIVPGDRAIAEIEGLADRAMAAGDRAARLRALKEIDEIVYGIYEVSETQRAIAGGFVPSWGRAGA